MKKKTTKQSELHFFLLLRVYVLGLRKDDLLMDDHPDVVEAIKRLPPEERDFRNFRLKRAMDLTMKHIILPEDQWTKPNEV